MRPVLLLVMGKVFEKKFSRPKSCSNQMITRALEAKYLRKKLLFWEIS